MGPLVNQRTGMWACLAVVAALGANCARSARTTSVGALPTTSPSPAQASPSTSPPPSALRGLDRPLQVGIVVDATEVHFQALQGEAPGQLEVWVGERLIGRFRSLGVEVRDGQLWAQPVGHPERAVGDSLEVRPVAEAILVVGEKPYRGAVEVRCAPRAPGAVPARLTCVNLVPLEAYLLGVVPLEIGWPGVAGLEVVKAQAVAARTYALSHLRRWPDLGFDLFGNEMDQVYGGMGVEHAGVSQAIGATRDVVLTYRGELARPFYSANCGGRTAPAEETWDQPPAPYLVTQDDSHGDIDFCSNASHYRWTERMSAPEVMALLEAHWTAEFGGVPPRGPLEALKVAERFQSGRVRGLELRAGGQRFAGGGDRLRWVFRRGGVDGAILRSSLFDLEVTEHGGVVTQVTLRGAGNGHGVGMCQSGAIEMARRGYTYPQILRHYYPGTELRPLERPSPSTSRPAVALER